MAPVILCATVLAALPITTVSAFAAEQPAAAEGAGQVAPVCEPSVMGSPYVPVDSWVYQAVLRLYGLGFVDDIFLGMRPYTRASLSNMLDQASARIQDADPGPATDQAEEIYEALTYELRYDMQGPCRAHEGNTRVESVYTIGRGISGTPLRDSYHLGSTVINDYGRPYSNGFNNYTGASAYASAGRFLIYARGEFDGAPSAAGYSTALAADLSSQVDLIPVNPATGLPFPQSTIPMGPISTTTNGHLLEGYVSAHYLNHEISFGKTDDWLGPGLGAGMAYSNNADYIYSFRVNRIEPLHIPALSRLTGPFRYEFTIGPLRGHNYIPYLGPPTTALHPNVTNPGDGWMHLEKISFRPTENVEFGFERTVIWGGQGHGPITLHTFLKSFFSFSSPSTAVKDGRDDPGARFGAFDASWRLPYMRKWLTFYVDSDAHDEVSPIDAPRRSTYRPGLYLSHVPGVPRLDLRVEGVNTDSATSDSQGGRFQYYEGIQKQGYTNRGQLFGDWIGREDKGGQGWITYHLSGNEWIEVGVRTQKAAKDFIRTHDTQYGTTLDDVNFQAVKRLGKDLELNGSFAYEQYLAPIYLPGRQTVTTTNIGLTWYPKNKLSF
ncbi:MAG: capsule assembly Wzi family protein [Terracidiphilus sp.]